jgi:hypothetical protein
LGDVTIVSSKKVGTVMNASLNRNQVEKRLLLAANEELEMVYAQKRDPCIALLISRNYRLLTQQPDAPELRIAWMQDAKYWWQEYLKKSTGKYVDFSFLIQDDSVFEPVYL